MRRHFVDTAFLIAHVDTRDSLHTTVQRYIANIRDQDVQLITTPLVIAEFLAHFSRGRSELRLRVGDYARRLLAQDGTVIELTPDLLSRGLELYVARPDKRYSLADCVSMLVCADLAITDVLTSDADFEHEGFRILLKGA